ncbi:uracil-DNA glycosylase [Halobacteriovorax marinus]|uniref:Uracil-DNA glycosylase n=1 Tax=Halobacteriovorax marinus TaxID=97084 RepID=A0A1Y5FIY5_9BACT|nr:uracil-DNA glycosylase [Halobacteriovorax marinus]
MKLSHIPLHSSWKTHLKDEFNKEYMLLLEDFLSAEADKGRTIFPKTSEIFEAFNQTPLNKVKVVIIGQDPYHGEDQAHGMSFSVNKGVKIPPSLRNIYKELESDLKLKTPEHGFLKKWAKQGVLLLNAVLTVQKSEAASHQKKGWETFTSKVIEILDENCEGLVFILWGGPAQKKAAKVNSSKHLILKSPHPSPLSSYRGFFGSKPFSKCNDYLRGIEKKEINWKID